MGRKSKQYPAGRGKVSANEDGKGFCQIPRTLLESVAYQSIKTLAGAKALPVFMYKFSYAEATAGKPICIFPYGEAEKLHGIPRKSFRRGLEELHSLGFIDFEEKGGIWEKNKWTTTTFRKSDRWRKYGTPDFVSKPWTPSEPSVKAKTPKRSKTTLLRLAA
jgi:hypothetical protein